MSLHSSFSTEKEALSKLRARLAVWSKDDGHEEDTVLRVRKSLEALREEKEKDAEQARSAHAKELEELKNSYAKLVREYDALVEKFSAETKTTASLRTQLDATHAALRKAQAHEAAVDVSAANVLRKEVEVLKAVVGKQNETLAASEAKMREAEHRHNVAMAKANSDRTTLDLEKVHVEKQLRALQEQQHLTSATAATSAAAAASASIAKAEAHAHELSKELSNSRAKWESEKKELQARAEHAARELAHETSRASTLAAQLGEVQQAMAGVESSYASTILDLRTQLHGSAEAKRAAEESARQAQAKLEENQARHTALRAEMSKLTAAASEAAKGSSSSSTTTTSSSSFHGASSSSSHSSTSSTPIKGSTGSSSSLTSPAHGSSASDASALASASANIAQLGADKARLERELASTKSVLDTRVADLQTAAKRKGEVEQELRQLRATHTAKIKELQDTIDAMTAKATDAQKRIETLEAEQRKARGSVSGANPTITRRLTVPAITFSAPGSTESEVLSGGVEDAPLSPRSSAFKTVGDVPGRDGTASPAHPSGIRSPRPQLARGDSNSSLTSLGEDGEGKKAALDKREGEIATREAQLRTREASVAKLEEELKGIRAQLEDAKTKLADSQVRLKRAEVVEHDLRGQIARLQEKAKTFESQLVSERNAAIADRERAVSMARASARSSSSSITGGAVGGGDGGAHGADAAANGLGVGMASSGGLGSLAGSTAGSTAGSSANLTVGGGSGGSGSISSSNAGGRRDAKSRSTAETGNLGTANGSGPAPTSATGAVAAALAAGAAAGLLGTSSSAPTQSPLKQMVRQNQLTIPWRDVDINTLRAIITHTEKLLSRLESRPRLHRISPTATTSFAEAGPWVERGLRAVLDTKVADKPQSQGLPVIFALVSLCTFILVLLLANMDIHTFRLG